MIPSPSEAKQQARRNAALARAEAARTVPGAADAAAAHFVAAIPTAPGLTVALYRPIKDELDTAPLAAALREAGATLALPVVQAPAAPLIFRRWDAGTPLAKGAFGAEIPDDTAPEVRPDMLIVPLLAFDARGYRLGYGGGFYDRTLAAIGPLPAYGWAYAAQAVQAVPTESTDLPLDGIFTERGAVWAASPAAPSRTPRT